MQAFILGAGLGTRLRPLTNHLPKPLVPLCHRPLAAWAVDACKAVGITRFAVNTHHLPDAWRGFPDRPEFSNCSFTFFHEPSLLETGGGLKNIQPWIGESPLLIHNGDIFSTLPLEKLIAAHAAGDSPITLALRTGGPSPHIALSGGRVTDIRGKLSGAPGTHTFTGIYCIDPAFLDLIPPGEAISVIPAFLALARAGKLAAITIDEGLWLDLGDRASYLEAHRLLALAPHVSLAADISPSAGIGNSWIGPGVRIGDNAQVKNSVLWPGTTVLPGANLDGCIISSLAPVTGIHSDTDF